MQSTQNGKNVISVKTVSQSEAIGHLNKFLDKEAARHKSLDSVVYLKKNIIEQIERIRDSLQQETQSQTSAGSEQ